MDDENPCGMLRLPVEIRQMIYALCYSMGTNSNEPNQRLYHSDLLSTEGKSRRRRRLGCNQPWTHLALLAVNRRIRNEYFPYFAANHTFRFQDPLAFANLYLSFIPAYRIKELRHISLSWTRIIRDMLGNSGTIDLNRDMRNLIRLWHMYPELAANLDSINFRIDPSLDGISTLTFGNVKYLLVKGVMQFLAEVANLLKKNGSPDRKFLIVMNQACSIWDIDVLVVSPTLWDRINDYQSMRDERCQDCAVPLGDRRKKHFLHDYDSRWKCEMYGPRLFWHKEDTQPKGEVSNEPAIQFAGGQLNWKVVFHPHQSRYEWERGMRELAYWISGQSAPGRKRKRVKGLSGEYF